MTDRLLRKLTIVVAGKGSCLMEVADDCPIEYLVAEALHEAGYDVRPDSPAHWELRTVAGLIVMTLTPVADGATLFLSPRAGVGG